MRVRSICSRCLCELHKSHDLFMRKHETRQICQCSHDALQSLRKEVSNVMPIHTPFTEIFNDSKEIYALSKQGEITLAIESNLLIGGTDTIIQTCEISIRVVKALFAIFATAVAKAQELISFASHQ
ncbi:hypothetical protein RB195_018740 [Necator americanus]|uniref:Uncharacterized protein n=1 Tax=Necator americanus TaxID=51031 RepID=A0ABR1CCC5_NECAM